jgi:hypothetical protein
MCESHIRNILLIQMRNTHGTLGGRKYVNAAKVKENTEDDDDKVVPLTISDNLWILFISFM